MHDMLGTALFSKLFAVLFPSEATAMNTEKI